jgi:hypothetical protein
VADYVGMLNAGVLHYPRGVLGVSRHADAVGQVLALPVPGPVHAQHAVTVLDESAARGGEPVRGKRPV